MLDKARLFPCEHEQECVTSQDGRGVPLDEWFCIAPNDDCDGIDHTKYDEAVERLVEAVATEVADWPGTHSLALALTPFTPSDTPTEGEAPK